MIGGAFCILIVRVGLGMTASQMASTYFRSQPGGNSNRSHPLSPIAVSVNRNVRRDDLTITMDEGESGYKIREGESEADLAESV
jgi:hypothetical protein